MNEYIADGCGGHVADQVIGDMTTLSIDRKLMPVMIEQSWESDSPTSRIGVTGNGVINGFVWHENMQIDLVPTLGAIAMLGVKGLWGR